MSRQLEPAQGVGGVVDLPLAAEEHEHVARPLARQLVDGVDDRLDLVAVVVGLLAERPVADLDRVGAARSPRRPARPPSAEVAGEALGVDRGRRDDRP